MRPLSDLILPAPFLVLVLGGGIVLGSSASCDSNTSKKSDDRAATAKSPHASKAKASADSKALAGKGTPVKGRFELICGCSLENVGQCGEHAKVDDQIVLLETDKDLGHMPFCGKQGLKADIEGELVDGKLVARTFEYAK